jgi:hypothetical protein
MAGVGDAAGGTDRGVRGRMGEARLRRTDASIPPPAERPDHTR